VEPEDLSILQLAGGLEYIAQLGVAASVFVFSANHEHWLVHRVILGHLPHK